MTKFKNVSPLLISVCFLVAVAVGCNQKSENGPPVTEGPTNSAAGTPQSATPGAQEREIAGEYAITGTNVNGGGKYAGDLTITKRDDVYQFSWASGGNSYDGVGVRTGNTIAVSFTDGSDGKGCGVVLYKIESNGDLSGKAGYWGVNQAESENAVRRSGTDLEGSYEVTGTNPGGNPYTGTLNVKRDGDGFAFDWNVGGSLNGYGIRQANMAAVGIGGAKCGFVMYEAKPDGSLFGKWGGQGSKTFGTENAVRKQ